MNSCASEGLVASATLKATVWPVKTDAIFSLNVDYGLGFRIVPMANAYKDVIVTGIQLNMVGNIR